METALALPQTFLAEVAIQEVKEDYWAKAKNPDKLYEAVDAKMKAQREFVIWYKAQPKDEGGRPTKTGDRSVSSLNTIDLYALFGVSDETSLNKWLKRVSRWRDKLGDEFSFHKERLQARVRCLAICEIGTARGTEGTGEFLRYTPPEYVEPVRTVMGSIELDPCSDETAQRVVKADRYFTEEDNGLEQDWVAETLFMNPPYSKKLLPKFVDKLIDELEAKRTKQAIMLVNACPDTAWFRKAAASCKAICFVAVRIPFWTPQGETVAPTQGQAYFLYGKGLNEFRKEFSKLGIGVLPDWIYRDE